MIQPNDETARTLWCGNLHDKVTEELLYELFLQAGPLEKVTLVDDKRSRSKYAFVIFKHNVSLPYTLQLMSGIRLYDQPLRLKERNGSGNSGSTAAEAVPRQSPMGPPPPVPPLMPPSPRVARPSLMAMGHSPSFNHHTSGGHARLLRSSSEPESLGTDRHKSQRPGNVVRDRERSAGPYFRPPGYQGPSQGLLAQNIASQLFMLNQANAVPHRNQHSRAPHSYFHGHQNFHSHFNDHSGFRRR